MKRLREGDTIPGLWFSIQPHSEGDGDSVHHFHPTELQPEWAWRDRCPPGMAGASDNTQNELEISWTQRGGGGHWRRGRGDDESRMGVGVMSWQCQAGLQAAMQTHAVSSFLLRDDRI